MLQYELRLPLAVTVFAPKDTAPEECSLQEPWIELCSKKVSGVNLMISFPIVVLWCWLFIFYLAAVEAVKVLHMIKLCGKPIGVNKVLNCVFRNLYYFSSSVSFVPHRKAAIMKCHLVDEKYFLQSQRNKYQICTVILMYCASSVVSGVPRRIELRCRRNWIL